MVNKGLCVAVTILILFVILRVADINFDTELINSQTFIDFIIALSFSITAGLYIYKKSLQKHPDSKELLPFFCMVISLIIILAYYVLRYKENYQLALSILVTGILVGMGWWIQAITTTRNSRRTHAFNMVMNTRTSNEYQENLRKGSKLFKEGRHVPKELADWRCNPDKTEYQNMKIEGELKDAINGLLYTLNYFEFLAQGIIHKDLDEKLIKECFSSILISLEKRGFYIITEAQKKYGKHFEGVIYLSKKWNGESIIEKHKGKPEAEMASIIGTPYPSADIIEKIKKGEEVDINTTDKMISINLADLQKCLQRNTDIDDSPTDTL